MKGGNISERVDLQRVEDYADKVMAPVDVEFTRHFFDRLTRPEHGKEITDAELIGFFKRLSKQKDRFEDFMDRYDEFVAKDGRTKLNIPFKTRVDQIIAKTVMRKDDFKTSNAEYKFEKYQYVMKHIKLFEQFLSESAESKFVEDKEPSLKRYLKKSPVEVQFGGTDEFDGGAQFFIHYKADSGNLQKLEKFLSTWINKEKTADVVISGYQAADDFSDEDSGWWTYAIDVYPSK